MQLERITPLILTYNEERNIRRTLDRLTWADRIVLVDSHSTDDTLDIVNEYAQVEVIQRPFDGFAGQHNFALKHARTEWVLPLDADYVLSDALIKELQALKPTFDSYLGHFTYCVFGKKLRGSLYPPRPVLFRRTKGRYIQDGHTQRLEMEGKTGHLEAPIYHDDRKPLATWLAAQRRYAREEAEKLHTMPSAQIRPLDRFRTYYMAPILVPLYCLFGKRLILDGRAGLYYTLQRTYAELILALHLLDQKLRPDSDSLSEVS